MASRVLIFTAPAGPGSGAAADALGAALRERGAGAEIVDGLGVAGPVARAAAGAAAALRATPAAAVLDAGRAIGARVAPVRGAGARLLEQIARPGLEAYLREHPAGVLVAAHPLWSELLASMRGAGTLATPVVSAITDLAGLRGWAHPGADLYLLTHPESEPEVRAHAGPGARVEAVHGLGDPRLADPPERAAARAELELPGRGSLVVVSAAGASARDVREATDTALHYGADTVVVLAGDEPGARGRIGAGHEADDRVQVWGGTDRMVSLLAAADVLIHSAAGPLVRAALLCDCRVISLGRGSGRARENNRALERLGMVAVARTRPQLAHALIHALAAPPVGAQAPELPAAADLVLELAAREPARSG